MRQPMDRCLNLLTKPQSINLQTKLQLQTLHNVCKVIDGMRRHFWHENWLWALTRNIALNYPPAGTTAEGKWRGQGAKRLNTGWITEGRLINHGAGIAVPKDGWSKKKQKFSSYLVPGIHHSESWRYHVMFCPTGLCWIYVSSTRSFVVCILPVQVSSPIAALFVTPQYNVTDTTQEKAADESISVAGSTRYLAGLRDIATVLFYTTCWIVAHAVVQEYIIDKLQRRLHLSKTKTSKFTESGHLAIFALYSVVHAAYIINQEHFLPEVSLLWSGYPENHREMSLWMKLFYLIQMSYWLHQFPEFYFQKSKKDEIRSRSFYSILYMLLIAADYCLKFKFFNILFVLVRLGSVTLAVLTFWYGLRSSEVPHVDIANGNFNTTFIRLNCLLCVCGLQVWLMWNFITFHLRRMRERAAAQTKPRYSLRSKQRKARKQEEELRNLPEADQETTRVLRSAKKKE